MLAAPLVGSQINESDYILVDDLLVQANQDFGSTFETKNIWDRKLIVNEELQYYSEGMNNVEWIDGNIMRLSAESPTGANSIPVDTADSQGRQADSMYTSKLLSTRGRRSYRYGRFVMRAKFPPGRGVWPAFWMLPEFDQWPPEYFDRTLPEIDIVEYIGDLINRYYGNVHFYENNEGRRSELQYECGACDMTTEVHTYALDWTPDFLVWWFDGQVRKVLPTPAQMHQHYHVIVNLAMGGNWPGDPTPVRDRWDFDIHSLKVYKSATNPNPPTGTGDPETLNANQDLIARLEPLHGLLLNTLMCNESAESNVRSAERELTQYLNELKGISQ